MKIICTIILSLIILCGLDCQTSPSDFGYRHFAIHYAGNQVDILVKSKKGEELAKKPLLFEVQGSTAVPLIVHDGSRMTSLVSLTEGIVEEQYHLILVNKPGLPLVCHKDKLTRGKYKVPNTNEYPSEYVINNNLDYYVGRNAAVINYLQQQEWVDHSELILVGHSQGSSIVTAMASKIDDVSHLIYSGGTPYYSQILAMMQQDRRAETSKEDSWVGKTLEYWADVVEHPFAIDRNKGWDTNAGTYSFSKNEGETLKDLNIPILISYGTKDESAPFNDMFHIETIKEGYKNISFNAYVGLDHYYSPAGAANASATDQLSTVINDWLNWLKQN